MGAPAIGAAAWCALFAAIQAFWAVGDTASLASSAGQQLADRRPTGFVIFGRYRVAALLLAGIALILMSTGQVGSRWLFRVSVFAAAVAIVLLLRAVLLEILPSTGIGGVRAAIGPLEARWSLALWNPRFAPGVALLMWTAVRTRRPVTAKATLPR